MNLRGVEPCVLYRTIVLSRTPLYLAPVLNSFHKVQLSWSMT